MASSPPSWYLRTTEGGVYGPASLEMLRDWQRQGRLNRECELSNCFPYVWLPADSLLPELFIEVTTAGAPLRMLPHRGVWLMALACLGLLCICPVFSISTWVMASADLRDMSAGRKDTAGLKLTTWAWRIGVTAATFWIAAALWGFLLALRRAADSR